MHNGIFPLFTKGRVLKKDSIEYLRDFPYDLAALTFEGYSDGLLYGFTVSYEDGYVIISKGSLKYQGNIIIVPESTTVIKEYGWLLFIKLIIGKFYETEDYISCPIEVKVDRNEPENEIELGRFCLKQGATLRCEYDSFNDLRTAENTLDLTAIRYAGMEDATLHPRILKEYARSVLASSTDASDTAFAMMCLNANVVHKSVIQWHIAKKTGAVYKDYTLKELYEKLAETLPRRVRNDKLEKPRGRGPNIIV